MPSLHRASLIAAASLCATSLFAQPARRLAPAQAPSVTAPSVVPPAGPAAPAEAPPAAVVAPPPAAIVAPPPTPTGPRTAVIDAAPIGVDPEAARYVTNVLRTSVGELGFAVIATAELHDTARRLQLPFPVPVDGMLLVERALQAPVAVTAEVRAAQGQYVVRLRVRVASEPQERVRDVTATQFQLADAIRAALPSLLVPPDPNAAPVSAPPPPPGGVENTAPAGPNANRGPQRDPGDGVRPARIRRVRAHPRRFELGVGVLTAFGPGEDAFINVLTAVRGGWFPLDRVGFTATVGYANLSNQAGRVSNVYFSAGIETAVELVPSSRIFIPLRAEFGYLPQNGPVFRITAGLSFQLSRHFRLEADILSPTLWVLPNRVAVSLDLGAILNYGF